MTTLKLSYFKRIMRRQGGFFVVVVFCFFVVFVFLEKTIMLGKTEGSRKRGRPRVRWTDSIKEATGVSVQEPGTADGDRTLWT